MSIYGDGEGGLDRLVHDWGYEPLMPDKVVKWEQLSTATHFAIGIYLLIVGKK